MENVISLGKLIRSVVLSPFLLKLQKASNDLARHMGTIFLVESERSERSEHTVVLSLRFLSIYMYIL